MRQTEGPALDVDKSVSIGKAAHITAASPGGPRYDPSLTVEERADISNGIWLCSNHADLIDKDEKRFPVDVLRKWKQDAEQLAFAGIAASESRIPQHGAVILQLDEADRKFLHDLALPAEDDIESVTARMREAATNDIAAFRKARGWPSHAIALNLAMLRNEGPQKVSLSGVAKGASVAEGVCIVSAPGTGKTTTLVQLADSILAAGQAVAALVPLGEWSGYVGGFFAFLMQRNAFRLFREQHFMQLAYHGRLVLLLDGWNELDPDSRIRATRALDALRRDFPLLGVVIATRQQTQPIPGAVVEIQALSEDQQLELARALRGNEGEAIVDQAWRTPGVRELVAIPLYLNALLGSTPGASFPQTKEEVIRAFVTQHEQKPEKAGILQKVLFGFHKDFLVGLAVEANRTAKTVISDPDARRAISKVDAQLTADGQLTIQPQPVTVLDVLVNTHTLIRSSSAEGGVSFQHQQFQEWYGSFEVERLMRSAAQGDAVAQKALRIEILNWPAWEESILFACERLSRENSSGANAVALSILDALAIDPMLAAVMIYRAASEAWPHIKDKILGFVNRWHTPDKVDRAVRFMITSGRPEFAPLVWPLISNPDSQVHLRALRAARRFRPSVLGSDAAHRLAALPEDTRSHVLGEIALESGFDGMELAANLAKHDASPGVVVGILQSLQFRHADRHVCEILQAASDEVWQLVAHNGYPDNLVSSSMNTRLAKMRKAQIDAETNPLRIMGHLTERKIDGAGDRLTQLIQSVDFPIKDQNARWAIHRAFEIYPRQVALAMLNRITKGLELPYGADEFLKGVAAVDDGPLAAASLNPTTSQQLPLPAFTVLGPKTVGQIMDQLFGLNDKANEKAARKEEADQKEIHRLTDAIGASRQASFLVAFLERAKSDDPRRIQLLAKLFAYHGKHADGEPLQMNGDIPDQIAAIFQGWIDVMLKSEEANRHQFSDVAIASARLAHPQLVNGLQKMLERDFADRARAREEYAKSPPKGPLTPDVTYCYKLQYSRAFAAIGCPEVVNLMKGYLPDLRFGTDAALVLVNIWNRDHPSDKGKRFGSWHNFSDVRAKRIERQDSPHSLPTSESAEAIFDVVKTLGRNEKDGATQNHAIKLATIGLSIPHGTKWAEVNALLNLPQPYATKRELLAAAAIAGEVIPAQVLIAGTHELLEAAKKDQWRLDESRGELMGWIELFPFSDRPVAVLDAINSLPVGRRHPWQLRRLLSAIGNSPNQGTLSVLEALLQRDVRYLQEHEWFNALVELGTEAAGRVLLLLICDGKLTASRGGADVWHLSQQLLGFARKYPAIHNEIVRRYPTMREGQSRAVLESALIEVADPQALLALIRGYAASNRPYDGNLSKAVHQVAVGARPSSVWPGAFEHFSIPLLAVRKQLFGMTVVNDTQSALAERCLISIEKLRDEHGRISDEPRHPDIDSGRAWPKEVYENATA